MKHDDLKAALEDLRREAADLGEAVGSADGRATPLLVAEGIVAAAKAAKRLARLREQLQGGGKKGGRRG